ncbi:MAG: 7-cyano-7-deazaguanine synthase [Methanobrevibacter sp.]|uniref:7-cyano-7-deazaguanine synthase n=1 Tax=Methanobrevibacter sp. TaxID=66852 RepID=UPI0026DF8C39|nr:7-cyano-7-deazaguanine synthase [Methanobrevibacter sp.]MDO5849156.1 7-cyano-7-deazaguanine synthase [Methanobrevibacter sp.]
MYSKETLLDDINKIREQIGHEPNDIHIKDIHFDEKKNELWIITEDRPDKSSIIGKGGWVVGKLREKTGLNKIHVESYGDFLLKQYKLELSYRTLQNFDNNSVGIESLESLVSEKLEKLYQFDLNSYMLEHEINESETHDAVVALSGGVDSSFSLILAKKLGFNPISITVNPGTIILPNQFKKNINNLVKQLNVPHHYIKTDYSDVIKESLSGNIHPCGRCSKNTEREVNKFAIENKIPIVIFGDMLSTGTQCLTKQEGNITRLNLPASLAAGKQEIKTITREYNVQEFEGFGCPLLYETHKKYPYHKKYSIQRILRETRSAALEPGEALDLIWSFYKTK